METQYIVNQTMTFSQNLARLLNPTSNKNHGIPHTLAYDPASPKDPLKPFLLINPEPETSPRHAF